MPHLSGLRKRRRWLRGVVLAVVGLLLGLGILVVALVWWVLPAGREAIALPGLSAPVEISFDRHGVAFIQAASDVDAAEALGFLHARDRLFQMDLMRRLAGGRLAELAGPAGLGSDEEMRRLGLARSAAADAADLSPAARAMLQAYAAGVNAWITRRGRFAAVEYVFLGRPAPWTVVDSLLWGKMLGLWLSGNWRTEMERLALSATLPRGRIDALWPPVPDTVLEAVGQARLPQPAPSFATAAPDAALAAAAALTWMRHFPQPFTQPAQASNEWVVSGAHTASHAPMVAGDPHLGFGFPSLWYLARIQTPDETLAGATAPGVPFMVIGHNRQVAWTFTSAGADVQDIFIEHRLAGGNDYQTPSGPAPLVTRMERIGVAGHADVLLMVTQTRHGPVVGTTADGRSLLAVEMANLAPHDTDSDGLLMLNRARSVAEVAAAAARITSPVQNLAVADTAGHIGFFTTGRVPLRRAGDGAWPVDGADGRHDWTGFASGSALPHAVDPASGVLINTNNPTVAPTFPVFLGRDAFGDWRARRIEARLAQSAARTLHGFAAIQLDVTSDFALRILPRLQALRPPAGSAAADATALLRGWPGTMRMDQPQPLLFNAWMRNFQQAVLRKNGLLGDDLPLMGDNFLLSLLGPGAAPGVAMWCGGDCGPLLLQSADTTMRMLRRRYGDNAAGWRWGTAHAAWFAHPLLSRLPVIGRFGRFAIAAPGDATTVDVAGPVDSLEDTASFTALYGPELRAVFDLSDLDASLFMIAPGQSGDLLQRHAADLLTRWRDGGTFTLGARPDSGGNWLRLVPGGTGP